MYVEFFPKNDISTEYTFGKMNLKQDVGYIFHESWIGTVPGRIALLDDRFKQYNINIDCSNKKILFMRTVGGGDMMFLSAIIKYIKDKFPTCTIDFCCIKEQREIAELIDGINIVNAMPLTSEIFDSYDYHFQMSGLIEHNNENHDRNVYDILFEYLGCEEPVDNKYKRPFLNVDQSDGHSNKKPKIGIHPFANDPIRELDINIINELIIKLIDQDYEVYLFSSQEEFTNYVPYINPNVQWIAGKPFKEVVEKLVQMDIMVCSDSIFSHLAQGLDIKTISIYGPFSSESRAKYYKNITIIDTNPSCRCFAHGVGQCPKGFKISPCLNVDPDVIFSIINDTMSLQNYIYDGTYEITIDKYNFEEVNDEK